MTSDICGRLTNSMAYTTSEARRELLDTVAQAANELGFASASLAEAYERLDEYNGDRLEAECFRPVGMAYGRAKRTHTDFAVRHGFAAATFEPQPTGLASQGSASFIASSVEAVGVADRTLADLQDRCCRWKQATKSCVPGSRRFGRRSAACPYSSGPSQKSRNEPPCAHAGPDQPDRRKVSLPHEAGRKKPRRLSFLRGGRRRPGRCRPKRAVP
jgi:hypothetical protein